MITSNTSLYVNENLQFGVCRDDNPPDLQDGELLVETLYSGVNPADIKHATLLGILPARLGYDFCGKVLEAPPTSPFKNGEIVAGYTPTGVGRPIRYGTHQRYIACREDMMFSVPSALLSSLHHAACLPVVIMTAADALYNIFQFPLPGELSDPRSHSKKSGPLLIWGASSSVGLCALQLAHASGIHPILVTASIERHALLRECGATHCFDYGSPTVRSEILKTLKEYGCDGAPFAFDAVGSYNGEGSAQLTTSCASADAILVSVIVQKDPRFRMPLAVTKEDVTIRVPGVPTPITIPARPGDHRRAWRVLQWAVENYGARFRFVNVNVFQGSAEDALKELRKLADQGRGFGKLVLQHPLE